MDSAKIADKLIETTTKYLTGEVEMVKKSLEKQAENVGFERDENGYGAVPNFVGFSLPDTPYQIDDIGERIGYKLQVLGLFDDPDAKIIAQEWLVGGSFTLWTPKVTQGDGWFLAGIFEHDEGPYAIFAKPIEGYSEAKTQAQTFLLGSLIKAATKHLKTLSVPWIELKEDEQASVLQEVQEDCFHAVVKAIETIASNGQVSFVAEVKSVTFKSGVKVSLVLPKSHEAHQLADVEGQFVTIVIQDNSELLQEGDSLEVDKDQRPLFDKSQG